MQNEVSIYDVARYILEKNEGITTMKLQKLCYYCQAWFLAWYDKPLFPQDFEAWANGAVCRDLYELHKGKYQFWSEELPSQNGNTSHLSPQHIEAIEKVLETYNAMKPYELSELNHNERPWLNARKGVALGEYCTNIISKEDMRDYYGGLIA